MNEYIFTAKDVSKKLKLSTWRIYKARERFNLGKKFGVKTILFSQEDIDFIKSRKGLIGEKV